MCTAIFIIVVIVVIVMICSSKKKDKRPENYDNEVNNLPNVEYHSREMSGTDKALNLWPNDSKLLDYFSFRNGILYLRMRNCQTLSGPIRQFSADFSPLDGGNYQVDLKFNGRNMRVFTYYHLFPDDEWYHIIAYLMYCGETRGVEKISGDKKTGALEVLKGVNAGIKIFNALSKM